MSYQDKNSKLLEFFRDKFEHTLRKKGGTWLGSVRNYIQCTFINGSDVSWGSNEILLGQTLTQEILIEVSVKAIRAFVFEQNKDILAFFDRKQNFFGAQLPEKVHIHSEEIKEAFVCFLNEKYCEQKERINAHNQRSQSERTRLIEELIKNNHYTWLDLHLEAFFLHVGLNKSEVEGIVSAHGDKCTQYREDWEKSGVPFFHGAALYLLTYCVPFTSCVRETKDGWVAPSKWVVEQYPKYKDFLLTLK